VLGIFVAWAISLVPKLIEIEEEQEAEDRAKEETKT
jgi:hypothetical protein